MISPFRLAAAGLIALGTTCISAVAIAQQGPIKIGIPTSIQLQVGRDTQNAAKMAVEEINAQGGLLGRKLEIVVADETENPEQGIAADQEADRRRQGRRSDRRLYQRCRHLAQLPHISNAKTIYLGIGAASPCDHGEGEGRLRQLQVHFPRLPDQCRASGARRWSISSTASSKASWATQKIAIVGENAKWVQDLVPILKKGAADGGTDVRLAEFFDTSTSDFSPLFAKVKESGAQYLHRHPLARLLGHLRQAMVRRAGADPDRRHRRKKPGRRLLRSRRRQGHRGNGRAFRHARAPDAEDDAVLG